MSRQIKIEDRLIGPGAPVFVIAEIGINHNGSEMEAAWLVDRAAEAGADGIKFQTVDAEESYAPGTASRVAFRDKDLPRDAYERLIKQSRTLGLVPFSTPGDLRSLDLIVSLGMRCIKISSGQMTNFPMLRAAAHTRLPLMISTGMADIAQVRKALEITRRNGANDLVLLHCTSLYPAPARTLNLRAMGTLREVFDVPVGYSDHHLGDLASIAAVAAGACVIEKHFTRDPQQGGADHAISLDPSAFGDMIGKIRDIEAMLGSAEKRPADEERRLAPERWRYLVARRALKVGESVTEDIIVAKRLAPGVEGVLANEIDSILGRRLRKEVAGGEPITESDLEGRS